MFKQSLLSLTLCGLVTGSVVCNQTDLRSRDAQLAEQCDIISNATKSEDFLNRVLLVIDGLHVAAALPFIFTASKSSGEIVAMLIGFGLIESAICGYHIWQISNTNAKVAAFKKIKEILLQQNQPTYDFSNITTDDVVLETASCEQAAA